MRERKPLRVWLELSPGDRVSGRLVDEAGSDHAFSGWLAFFSLIDQLEARDAGHSRVEPHDSPGAREPLP